MLRLENRSFYNVMMIVSGLMALLLTVLPGNSFIIRFVVHFISQVRFGDTIGHGLLFGGLTLIIWRGLYEYISWHWALMLAMFVALSIGTATEIYQWSVSSRAGTMEDMLANWLGVFGIGFLLSFFLNLKHTYFSTT